MENNPKTTQIDGSRIIMVDPNPIGNEFIPPEELSIFVDLETVSRSRSIVVKDNNGFNISNTGVNQSTRINFIKGDDLYGNNKKDISTYYTEVGTNFDKVNPNLNTLGITNIDIEFSSAYAPLIKIDFVDIRGGLFQKMGRYSESNGQDGERPSYAVFFELPYPIFKLKVKGYYGQMVEYCLHLTRFNSRFNSETGNFEFTCQFVGYTYAFLSDLLMGMVRAAGYTNRGKEILKGKFIKTKNGQTPCPTLVEFGRSIIELKNDLSKIKQANESIGSISLGREVVLQLKDLKTLILSELNEPTEEAVKNLINNSEPLVSGYLNNSGVFVYNENTLKQSNFQVNPLAFSNLITNIQETPIVRYNNYIKTLDGLPELFRKLIESGYEISFKDLFLSNNNFIEKIDKSNFINFNSYSEYSTNQSVKNFPDQLFVTENGESYFSEIKGLLNSKTEGNLIVINYNDLFLKINQIIIELEKKIDATTTKIAQDIKELTSEKIGFDTTIEAYFNILTVHIEILMQLIYETADKAERQRNINEIKQIQENIDKLTNDNPNLFPFPEFKEKKDDDGFIDAWIGKYAPNLPEAVLVEEFATAFLEMGKEDADFLTQLNEIETRENAWVGVNVFDSPLMIGVNPWQALSDDKRLGGNLTPEPYSIASISRLATLRAFIFLAHSYSNVETDKIIKMAKIEANNCFNFIPNKEQKQIISAFATNKEFYENFIGYPTKTDVDNVEDKNQENYVRIPNKRDRVLGKDLKTPLDNNKRMYRELTIDVSGVFDPIQVTSAIKADAGLNLLTTIITPLNPANFIDQNALDKITQATNTFVEFQYIYNNLIYDELLTKQIKTSTGSKKWKELAKESILGKNNDILDFFPRITHIPLYPPYNGDRFIYNTNAILSNGYLDSIIKYETEINKNDNAGSNLPNNSTILDIISDIYNTNDINFSSQYGAINGLPSLNDGATYIKIIDPNQYINKNLNYPPYVEEIIGEDEIYLGKFLTNDLTIDQSGNNSKFSFFSFSTNPDGLFFKDKITPENLVNVNNLSSTGFFSKEIYGGTKNHSTTDILKNRKLISRNKQKEQENKYFQSDDSISTPNITFYANNRTGGPTSNSASGYYYSLFGSDFYYGQTSEYAKSFLFLNSLPIAGLNDILDSGLINGYFGQANSIINVPYVWCLKVGSILFRYLCSEKEKTTSVLSQYNNIYKTQQTYGVTNDIIQFSINNATISNFLLPNKLRVEQWIKVESNTKTFNEVLNILSPKNTINVDGNPRTNLDFDATFFKPISNDGTYSKNTILNFLPRTAQDEFVKIYLDWVNDDFGGWKQFKDNLEIFKDNTNRNQRLSLLDLSSENMTVNTNSINTSIILNQNFKSNYRVISFDGVVRSSTTPALSYGLINYSLELRDTAPAVDLIRKLFQKEKIVLNSTWRIWKPFVATLSLNSHVVRKDRFDVYTIAFASELHRLCKEDSENTVSDNEINNNIFSSIDNEDIKITIYKNLKNLYDKWIAGNENYLCVCGNCENNGDFIDNFLFIDRAYKKIGNDFLINPINAISHLMNNNNSSFYDYISRILSDNNFDFQPLPAFIDFTSTSELQKLFQAKRLKTNEKFETISPKFVCIYSGEKSSQLDIPNGNYENDGFDLTETTLTTDIPKDFILNQGDDAFDNNNVPAFLVRYAKQNQSIFKDIRLDQQEFTETLESLVVTDMIANKGNTGPTNQAYLGQNLYNVYNRRSYACEVEMLGNSGIQPFMYFQLNNIPMFHGVYMITKVSHNIKPNHMTTKFKGVRVRKTKTKLVDETTLFMNLLGTLTDSDFSTTTSLSSLASDNAGVGSNTNQTINSTINNSDKTISLSIGAGASAGASAGVGNIPNHVKIANEELQRWGGRKETDPNVKSILTEYWRNLNLTQQKVDEYINNKTFWSAAFISKTLINTDFKKSSAHRTYILHYKNNPGLFSVVSGKSTPKVGDLLIKTRTESISNINQITNSSPLHVDVVVNVNNKSIKVIGGNLGNTVQILSYDIKNNELDDSDKPANDKILGYLKYNG